MLVKVFVRVFRDGDEGVSQMIESSSHACIAHRNVHDARLVMRISIVKCLLIQKLGSNYRVVNIIQGFPLLKWRLCVQVLNLSIDLSQTIATDSIFRCPLNHGGSIFLPLVQSVICRT